MAIRVRSWIIWVMLPVVVFAVGAVALFWHPIPPRKTFGDELMVNGHRIALPLARCGFDTFLDGGSRVMACEDRHGEIHVFVCRWPGYRELMHQHRGKIQFDGSISHYGTLVADDADVRNLLYWHLDDLVRKAGVDPGITDLYPSLFQRWFAHWF